MLIYLIDVLKNVTFDRFNIAQMHGAPRNKQIDLIARRDPKNHRRLLLYGIFFSFLLFFASLARPTFFDFLSNQFFDTLLSAHTGQPSPIPIIVDIDEKSLRQYGQWPWPRYRIAILLDKLRGLGASGIGLDMVFAEDDRTSIVAIQKEFLHDFGIKLGFAEVPRDLRDSDKRLADALSRGNVVLGYQFLFEEDSDSNNCLLHSLHINKLGDLREEEFIRFHSCPRGILQSEDALPSRRCIRLFQHFAGLGRRSETCPTDH